MSRSRGNSGRSVIDRLDGLELVKKRHQSLLELEVGGIEVFKVIHSIVVVVVDDFNLLNEVIFALDLLDNRVDNFGLLVK